MKESLLKTIIKSIIPAVIIAIIGVWFFVYAVSKNDVKYFKINIKEAVINAKIVEKEADLMMGLGGVSELGEGEGMWFIFLEDSKIGIWMRDMKIPIDIIWFDKNLKIVDIKEGALPESYPEIFYPKGNARYVLEINAGFSKKQGIKIGDIAKISKINF